MKLLSAVTSYTVPWKNQKTAHLFKLHWKHHQYSKSILTVLNPCFWLSICVELQSRNWTEIFSRGSWHFTAFIAHFVQYLLKQPPLCHLKTCGVYSCLAARYLCIIKTKNHCTQLGGVRRESKSDCYHVRFFCRCFRLLPFKNIQT